MGLIALAIAVAVVAFVVLSPGDTDEDADDPAGQAAQTTPAQTTEEQPTATAPSAPPPPPDEIVVKGGKPEGGVQRIEVTKGDTVRLLVSSDGNDEIHLHGYDITRNAAPGQAGPLPLQGGRRGRLRDREPHGGGRRARAARGPPGGRARLMLEIAHGIVGRTDLPIPEWLFGWGAAMVLVVSFVALAVLWPEPRLQDGGGFRALPRGPVARAAEPAGRDPVRGGGRVPARAHRLQRAVGLADGHEQLRAELRVRDLLALAGAAQPAVRRHLQGVQPVARDRPARWRGGADGRARPAACAARVPGAARPLARRRRHLRVRRAGAGRLERRQAGERGDRGARLLGRHVRGDGAVRDRPLDRAGRGVQRLLQPLLAHLAGHAPRRRARPAQAPVRPGGARSRSPARCRCWR